MKDLAQVQGVSVKRPKPGVLALRVNAYRGCRVQEKLQKVSVRIERTVRLVSCRAAGSECKYVTTAGYVCDGVALKSGRERFSTEQPVRHNAGHQQSLPHTGYQHGTALGTRSALQETSSRPGGDQSERRC